MRSSGSLYLLKFLSIGLKNIGLLLETLVSREASIYFNLASSYTPFQKPNKKHNFKLTNKLFLFHMAHSARSILIPIMPVKTHITMHSDVSAILNETH